ncbi:MAG TPA: ClpX C4-type zinc finger protein [Caulobacteraceae bacterium]|jgi:hypothetical protein
MRDFRDAKSMAKGLRRSLADLGTDLTHSQSLELIAQAFGFDNWNILAAKIEAARPAPAEEKRPADETLHCGFCGKSQHDVKTLIAGPATFICDECVAICDDVIADNEVMRHLKDPAQGGDPEAALEAYLAGHGAEQLAAYLARNEKHFDEEQQMLARFDGEGEPLPEHFLKLDAAGREKARSRLARQHAVRGKSVAVVARVLAARS